MSDPRRTAQGAVPSEPTWAAPSIGSIAPDHVVFVKKPALASHYLVFQALPAEADNAGNGAERIEEGAVESPPPSLVDGLLLQSTPPPLNLPADDIYVLISTKSGTERAVAWFETVLRPTLRSVGLHDKSYTTIATISHDSISYFTKTVLLEKANAGTRQTVLLLSGDGGIVDIVNGLAGNPRSSTYVRPAIAIFPLGTGNALFHSLHRNSSHANTDSPAPVAALRTLVHGTNHPLPIFRATFSPSATILSDEGQTASPIPSSTLYGAVVASYGFHATLVADSDTVEWRKHGDKRFGLVAKDLLYPPDGTPPHAYKAHVTLHNAGGAKVLGTGEHEYILLTLVSNLEKTFTISPASQPLDGQLRVVHFGPRSADEIMRIMQLAYDGGKHVEAHAKLVDYEGVQGLRIDFQETGADGRWRRVCIDGLIVRIEEGGWVEVAIVPAEESVVDVLLAT